jgi:hypothetical protein
VKYLVDIFSVSFSIPVFTGERFDNDANDHESDQAVGLLSCSR